VTLAGIEGEPLALEEAVTRALREATRAREAEAALRAAEGEVRRERGAFDPVIFAEIEVSNTDQPTASPFAGADVLMDEQTLGSAGARIRLPIGTELEAAVETRRLETNSAFAFLNPEYTSAGRLEIRQPLLKGFGPSARSRLTSAERDLDAAASRREDAVFQVVAEVTSIYWDLYAAERDYAVQQLIVERAEVLLSEAELRAEVGLVGPSEVATARVFLAEQKLAAFDREEELDELSDELVSLIGRRPSGPRFRPTTEPTRELPVEPVARLLERAFDSNRELRAAERNLEALRAEVRGARWSAFPTLDLTGSLGGNGLSGQAQEVVDFQGDTLRIAIDGGLSDAVSQSFQGDFPTWSLGVHLTVPIGFRADRGELDRLRAETERAEQQIAELKHSIEERVRAANRRLVNGTGRLEIAREGVDASLEQVRIGQIEFRNGRTTAFELVRLGADVAEAEQRYSEALVRTAKAAAELERLAPTGPSPPRRTP
jgi:outer membrane protein TolC